VQIGDRRRRPGVVPASLYQASPSRLPAWFIRNVAPNPQRGENELGVVLPSAIQSIDSPWLEKNV
jgi:hypothetical protein